MQKLNIIFVVLLVLLNFQSISGNFSLKSKKYLKGIDPASGFSVEYGCYNSKCFAYCNGLDKMWCWTNKKAGQTPRACSSDSQCDGYYYKCVGPCRLQ